MAAFLIARYYSQPLLSRMFSEKTITKYGGWLSSKLRFARCFAVAIFLHVAPDDFLCYLAGTTDMSLTRFTTIILLGKFAIALYSMGLMAALTAVSA